MKYIFLLILLTTATISCKKEVVVAPNATSKISQDSMVKNIHQKWKFTVAATNPAVTSKLNSWDDWRNYVNELTIAPNASLANLTRKANALVEKSAVLKKNIPEMYNRPETKARMALLETNIQNLDMLLELEPLNSKEIIHLLANIQKNTNSILYQFNEFEIKAKIPKESGEEQLIQPIDTIKRATLNALPQE
ncbi:hypothetical protein [Paenimyroides aestuarii]|uniref:Uncharacterized protein n=1 Tax=Paenimyroides aestuarii TaxID=2968490 RepID=A0ABY5NU92_9FLAO|nr:hypothetical protein [Paenimyroides aestuarii]UUV22160.1 hypothetical protein NPX36_03750 [Paenimyroides aestuarii]